MAQLAIGFFNNSKNAGDAVAELKNQRSISEISLVTKDFEEEYIDTTTHTIKQDLADDAAEGAVSGGAVGAVIGGLATVFAGVTAITIPAAGLFVVGPLASALVGTATGATIGAVTGALVEMGLPESEAKAYEDRIIAGEVLVAVKADALKMKDVLDTLQRHEVSFVEVQENV